MNLPQLNELLSRPESYPHPVDVVEVHQTHISVVFLAGPFAYKIKKPVDLGFLDFRTLEQRRHFCLEEVRLNRRLAPGVYLGVVPVTAAGIGREDQAAEAIEWAVKMERLPHDATLSERLRRGELTEEAVESLARKVAESHRTAPVSERAAAYGCFEAVSQTLRHNFEQAATQREAAATRSVLLRISRRTEEWLKQLRPLIEERAERGMTRECHGDLRLEHVYALPDGRLVIVDCLEFSRSLRCIDTVADVAFLVMDLKFHGRSDLARHFADAYFRESGDDEGRKLLPLYTAYRAIVRAKVEGLKQAEAEVPKSEKTASAVRARAYWLLALGELERPERRPCLVMVGGLPGVGKSTLARHLSRRAGFSVIRSAVVRKELAGSSAEKSEFEYGRYAPAWTKRTYGECRRRAEELLRQGERVIVDASFREEGRRRTFLDAGERMAVPAMFLDCRADPKTVQARLAARRGDASDAGWDVYCEMAKRWEPPAPRTRDLTRPIDTDGGAEQAIAPALSVLRERGLTGPEGE